MAHINLLPWREERRRQLTIEFARQAVLAAFLAAVVGGYGWYHVNGLIEAQEERNDYLEEEIAALDEKIREIRELESTRERLIARMDVIQDLQQRRPQVVHLFDQMARRLPDGVHLVEMEQNGDDLTLRGRAESNSRVSSFMRNLGASDWLKSPSVEVIETDEADRVNAFTLNLSQTTPDADEDADGDAGEGGS